MFTSDGGIRKQPCGRYDSNPSSLYLALRHGPLLHFRSPEGRAMPLRNMRNINSILRHSVCDAAVFCGLPCVMYGGDTFLSACLTRIPLFLKFCPWKVRHSFVFYVKKAFITNNHISALNNHAISQALDNTDDSQELQKYKKLCRLLTFSSFSVSVLRRLYYCEFAVFGHKSGP